jgi:hypothetical protein
MPDRIGLGTKPKSIFVEERNMLKAKTSLLAFFCFGLLALPATPATYDYYLQVPADPQAGLAAWTATWTSDNLNPPLCPAGIVSPFLVGAPITGYTAAILFCINVTPGGNVPTVLALWQNLSAAIANYTFTSPTASFTTGVFALNGGTLFVDNPTTATFNQYNSPNATLTITEQVSFPPVPRWTGSIIRVSLTVAGPVTPPPGVPVEAQVGFVDLNGNPVGQFPPVQITPGQISSFELAPGTSPVPLGHHTAVVPVVSAPPGQVLPPLQLTTEVLDSLTGYGAVLTTATGLAPPPASFAPQGLAFGQIMRLTATAFPPDPCDATLSFANSEGAAIGPSVTVNLSPGQSQSLDLPSAALNLTPGHQAVIQPMVALQPVISIAAVAAPACMVSSDVFDTLLGRTWTYQTANLQ